ncbi:MAG: NAD-dependent epimerase/dehydratase family protein [Solirubrobacteraceae bacterium]
MTSRAPTVLVTGAAGFLGSHLSESLLRGGHEVIGVDCFTDYYQRALKEANVAGLRGAPGFTLLEADLSCAPLEPIMERVDVVYHLAAQPGVRPSFGRGFAAYLRDNVLATQRLLEAAADTDLQAFVYASSSSVYGNQATYPAREDAPLSPVSPYGATKVIAEQLAGAFWASAGVPVVGLRYFTVYGPRQRPDMAFCRFLSSALAGRPLSIFGDGRQVREFTFVDDVVRATIAAAERGKRGSVYNVGGGTPVALLDVIELLMELLGDSLEVEHLDAGPGDPRRTDADISRAIRDLGYSPSTPLRVGLSAQLASLEGGSLAPAIRFRDHVKQRRPSLRAGAARPAPRILAYSHDGYGLGHMRRNLRLVTGLRRLRPDVEAMLVTGAKSAARLVQGSGIACTPLPAVVKVANGSYAAADGEGALEDIVAARAEIAAAAVREFKPDLLLVDRYPRGMRDELVPALRLHAAQRPGAPVVLGLRDILDTPEVIRHEWQTGGYDKAILEIYSAVLCYGDRSVYDPISAYGLPPEVAERFRFTGYLADELLAGNVAEVRARHRADGRRLAVCTLGGGKDAAEIARGFLGAIDHLRDRGWSAVLITGPYMSSDDLARLLTHPAADKVDIIEMVEDVPSYLGAADAAVCMGGYNTTCELLALGVPAVIIPRVQPRQEQRMRAELLSARGLITWMHPNVASAEALAEKIEQADLRPRTELAQRLESIACRGIETAAHHLAALLPAVRTDDQFGPLSPGRIEITEQTHATG